MAAVGWVDASSRGGRLAQILLFSVPAAGSSLPPVEAREIEALAARWFLAPGPDLEQAVTTRAALVLDLKSLVLMHAGAPAFALPKQATDWTSTAQSVGHVVLHLGGGPPSGPGARAMQQHLADAAPGSVWSGRVRTTGTPQPGPHS